MTKQPHTPLGNGALAVIKSHVTYLRRNANNAEAVGMLKTILIQAENLHYLMQEAYKAKTPEKQELRDLIIRAWDETAPCPDGAGGQSFCPSCLFETLKELLLGADND